MEPEAKTHLEENALEYLKKHKIVELFQNMTAILVFHRPKKPKMFLVEYLEGLNEAKISGTGIPCFMDETNIKSLFNLLDPTSKGYISLSKYQQAMKTLLIKKCNQYPTGWEENHIEFEVFQQHVEQGLKETWATFLDSDSIFT